MAYGVAQSLICRQSAELKNILIDGAVIDRILGGLENLLGIGSVMK